MPLPPHRTAPRASRLLLALLLLLERSVHGAAASFEGAEGRGNEGTGGFTPHAPTSRGWVEAATAVEAGAAGLAVDEAQLDAVLIASPDYLHGEMIEASIEAKLHTLTESPLSCRLMRPYDCATPRPRSRTWCGWWPTSCAGTPSTRS